MPVRVDDPDGWRSVGDPDAARPAAVLVLIAPDASGEARVVLIERQSYEGHHSGEIAFPGGSAEAGDADSAATALREASEEIGLVPDAVRLRIVGLLETFWIPVSDFRVTPVLAIADRLPPWRLDAREVAGVIEAPLRWFLPGAPILTIERTVRAWRIRYGAYPLDDGPGPAGAADPADRPAVWGATARILGQLGAIVGRI